MSSGLVSKRLKKVWGLSLVIAVSIVVFIGVFSPKHFVSADCLHEPCVGDGGGGDGGGGSGNGSGSGLDQVEIVIPTFGNHGPNKGVLVGTDNEGEKLYVHVWANGRPGDAGSAERGKEGGVYVYNVEDDPLTVKCYIQDPPCAYFQRLSDQERDKQAKIEDLDDMVRKDLMTNFTTDCPTYAKIAGVGKPENTDEQTQEVTAPLVSSIKKSVCRIVIDNWADLVMESTQAVKMAISETFTIDFIDAVTRKFLIKNVISNFNRYQEAPEDSRPEEFFSDSIGGTWVEPGTDLLAFNRRLTRPMSTARLVLSTFRYLGGEANRAEFGLMEEVRSGGGYFGKHRCASFVVSDNGEESCAKYEINALSGDVQHVLHILTEATLNTFVNTIDFNKDISSELLPTEDPNGVAYGGWPGYRDLLNSFNGGPGFFRYMPSGGFQPPPGAAASNSVCDIYLSDGEIVMGQNEQRQISFTVQVGLSNGGDGSVSDLQQVSVKLSDSQIATTTPSFLKPTGTTSSEEFSVKVISAPNSQGDAKIEINAKLKSSAGGGSCQSSIDLTVLGFRRYPCDSARCKSPLVDNDPDKPIYTCVGTPNDGLNNDCTSLGSNCLTEWCVDIGDQDGDGFNAYCFDSCPADQQSACQARGYICQATSSAVFSPKKFGLPEPIKRISYLLSHLFSF